MRVGPVTLTVALLALQPGVSSATTFANAPGTAGQSDFNGDGFADLAVGVPYEEVGGAVAVLYGSPEGLSSAGNELWSQDSPGILDQAERDDYFGWSLAAGDFNGDGISDLAVHGYGEGVGGDTDQAGAVNVIYGSPGGLTSEGNQFWTQDSPGIPDRAEVADLFGWAMSAGDLNGDGFADLAVGVPNEGRASLDEGGIVHVLYGSAVGLTAEGTQIWSQDSPGVPDAAETIDHFGEAVATGDLDQDGFDDLAIGANDEEIGGASQAGAVNVLYGSELGLTSDRSQFWSQASPGIVGNAESVDQLGFSLAIGDFDGDGFDDLAAGALGESLGADSLAGAVNVIYGSGAGLSSTGDQIWSQDAPGVEDRSDYDDWFGWRVAAGDFNGDGTSDLAVGANHEDRDLEQEYDSGSVTLLYGTDLGLSSVGDQFWTQNSSGVIDSTESHDYFGGALRAGNFGLSSHDDLAIGAYGEGLGSADYAGAVNVLYGTEAGLSSEGNQFWNQDSSGVLDEAGFFDLFGAALA